MSLKELVHRFGKISDWNTRYQEVQCLSALHSDLERVPSVVTTFKHWYDSIPRGEEIHPEDREHGQDSPRDEGSQFVPALAGFQSEHEVEIPFMLTSEKKKNSENHSAGIKTAVHWVCLGLF